MRDGGRGGASIAQILAAKTKAKRNECADISENNKRVVRASGRQRHIQAGHRRQGRRSQQRHGREGGGGGGVDAVSGRCYRSPAIKPRNLQVSSLIMLQRNTCIRRSRWQPKQIESKLTGDGGR